MDAVKRFGAPVTAIIGATTIVAFVASFFGAPLEAFGHVGALSQPWTALSYPLAPYGSIISLLFTLLTLAWVGKSTEEELGSQRFAAMFLSFIVAAGLALTIGARFIPRIPALAGMWVPISALLVYWGMTHRTTRVMLYGIIPLTGLWIAILSAVIAFFGSLSPVLGFFCLIPCALAYVFATKGVPGASPRVLANRPTRAELEKENLLRDDEIRRRARREEDERLRKLLGE